jgi:hypothetical protein
MIDASMSEHPVISERDRQDASAVTVSGSGHVFEIQLGHMCNNRCVFCSSGMLTEQGLAKPVPLADIFAAVEQAKQTGAHRLIFLGGEPTLHRGFLPTLAHAVELGFDDIVIFTNGVLLPQPGFIDKVVALGNFEWRISIQGADEASHVAVTKREHSFSRIMTGLGELARRGQRVTMNMCVTAASYASLPGYPALVREHGIAQVHIDIIRPASTGRRSLMYFRDIMPRYSDMAPDLERMLEGFDGMDPPDRPGPSVEVTVGNLPHCVLRRWPRAVFHGGDATVTAAADKTGLEPDVDKYAWHAGMRRHVPACEGCVLRGDCTGVFETYLEVHGDAEFQAVDEAELLALAPARRPFQALVRRSLAGLLARADAPPSPFRLEHRSDERSARVLALTYVAGPDRVTLRFESPEHSGDAGWASDGAPLVLQQPVWTLALIVDPGVHEALVGALLDWSFADTPALGEAAREGWARARQLAPLRARALRSLDRLRAEPAPPGWRWVAGEFGRRRRDGRPEVAARLRTDDGPGHLDVVLALALADGDDPVGGPRSIELDFRRGDGLDAVTAEPVITAVVTALKRG